MILPFVSLAVLIGEENLTNMTDLILLMQKGEESLKDGFTVVHNDQEFNFVPEYVDRYGLRNLLYHNLM